MFAKIFFILTIVILDGVRCNFSLYLFAFPWNISLYIYCPLILLTLKMIVPFICSLTDLIICGLDIWYFMFFIYLVIHHLSNKYLANIFFCALRRLFCDTLLFGWAENFLYNTIPFIISWNYFLKSWNLTQWVSFHLSSCCFLCISLAVSEFQFFYQCCKSILSMCSFH